MNTQSITYNQFIQENSLELFKSTVIHFKNKSKNGGLSATEHMLYNLIRGFAPARGFTTPKITYTEGYHQARQEIQYQIKYAKNPLLVSFQEQTLNHFLAEISHESR